MSLQCPRLCTRHFLHISSFRTPNISKCHLTPFTGDKLRLTEVKWLPKVPYLELIVERSRN